MTNIHAMAGGSVGYVRGLASVRCGGVAFPLDLVRAVAKTAARLAVRRRVGAAFAGYLVSESGPDVRAMFSKNREWHSQGVDIWGCTSERQGLGFNAAGVLSGPIDAPESIAGGGWVKREHLGQFSALPALLDREAAFDNGAAWLAIDDREPVFSERRWWHDLAPISVTGRDMTRRRDWREGAEGDGFGGLDAPDWIAAGSCVLLSVLKNGRRLARCNYAERGGL